VPWSPNDVVDPRARAAALRRLSSSQSRNTYSCVDETGFPAVVGGKHGLAAGMGTFATLAVGAGATGKPDWVSPLHDAC
jgi:hypothetical protein